MGERSKVYMTDLRCRPGVSLLNKLEKLMRTAGIGEINFERKLVAIKMHFGEPGNLAIPAAGKTPWSTWTQPMRTASPRCPPAAR